MPLPTGPQPLPVRTVESLKPLLYAAAVALGLGSAFAVAYLSLRLDQPPHRIIKLFIGAIATVVLVSLPGIVPYMLLLALPFVAWLPKSPVPFLNTMNLLVGIGVLGVILLRSTARARTPKLPGIWTVFSVFVMVVGVAFLRGWIAPPSGYNYPAAVRAKSLWSIIAGMIAFLPFYHYFDSHKAMRRALGLFAVALALGALGCVNEAHGARIGYRVKGGLGDVNDEAAFYAMGLCFLLPVLARARAFSRGARTFMLVMMAVSTLGLVMPNSRGALLSFAVAGFLYVGVVRRKMLPVYVMVLVLGWFSLPGTVRDRMSGTYSEVVETGGDYDAMNYRSGGRLDIWKATIDAMAGPNAVIGVGYGNLPILLNEEIAAYRNSHNVYLQLWGEAGLPGIAIFLTLMVAMLKMGWKLRRREDPLAVGVGEGMICSVCCLGVANLFGDRFLSFSLEALVVFIAAAGARMLFLTEPPARESAPMQRIRGA